MARGKKAKSKGGRKSKTKRSNGAGRKPDMIPEKYREAEPEWRAFKAAAAKNRDYANRLVALQEEAQEIGSSAPLFVRYLRARAILHEVGEIRRLGAAAEAEAVNLSDKLNTKLEGIDGSPPLSEAMSAAFDDAPPIDRLNKLRVAFAERAKRRRRGTREVAPPEPEPVAESTAAETTGETTGATPTESAPPAEPESAPPFPMPEVKAGTVPTAQLAPAVGRVIEQSPTPSGIASGVNAT